MSFSPTILIIEDEQALGQTLKEYLETQFFNTHWAQNCHSARELLAKVQPDIVLMDIGLPDGNGIDLAKEFFLKSPKINIIFLTAMNDPVTRLHGFETGAADYITKPFQLRELILRLKRFVPQDVIQHGLLTISFKQFEITDANGLKILLNQKECAILKMLYEHTPNVVSREDMLEQIWGQETYPSNRTVDNYIVKLRKWCETDPHHHISITSVRGIGYKLEVKNE